MSYLAHLLRERVQIKKVIKTADPSGGFFDTYETIRTVWCSTKPIMTNEKMRTSYIRGEQVGEEETHKFLIRYSGVSDLGGSFTSGFSIGYKGTNDATHLKSDYYLFMERGSSVRGKLYRIMKCVDIGERREYLQLFVQEVEEQGTGWNNDPALGGP